MEHWSERQPHRCDQRGRVVRPRHVQLVPAIAQREPAPRSELAALESIGQFIPLPTVTNKWHRATADVQYFFTSHAGAGVGYYFEKLDVADFNTIDTNGPVGFEAATGDPRIDWLGALTTGYGNRPYTGNSVYVRLLYRF